MIAKELWGHTHLERFITVRFPDGATVRDRLLSIDWRSADYRGGITLYPMAPNMTLGLVHTSLEVYETTEVEVEP